MPNLLLHVGAHRTGTTSIQKFLSKNQPYFTQNGIQCVFPPYTRELEIDGIQLASDKIIISEENILGTMENNLWKQSLYPNIESQLGRYPRLLREVNCIFITIRNYVDWWSSALLFMAKTGVNFPSDGAISSIVANDRGWPNVIREIREFASGATIVVREFNWKTDNPKQVLRAVTRWPELASADALKAIHNARPSFATLSEKLLERGDTKNIDRLAVFGASFPFSNPQAAELDARYLRDIEIISTMDGVKFLGASTVVERAITERRSKSFKHHASGEAANEKTCFLHIGKTGGTYFKSVVKEHRPTPKSLFIGKHGDTLLSTIGTFGSNRKLAFFFRSPEERFSSGFCSRLRQGRPVYNVNWTPAEAISFSFFRTPNELAESLSSKNDRLLSAAHFAFANIFHLKFGYQHYLSSKEAVLNEFKMGNILVCCETKQINSKLEKILEKLHITSSKNAVEALHENPNPEMGELSEQALKNLKKHFPEDFAIAATCKEIASKLGYAD